MSNSPVTLKTIAQLAGVTPITVSRALRHQPGISEPLRQRILELAATHHYTPDVFASLLTQRKRRSDTFRGTLACLIGHHDCDPRGRYEHYELVLRGMQERAAAAGFAVDPFWAFERGMHSQRLHGILQARHISGCILLSLRPEELALPWEHYSIVHAAANSMQTSADYTAIDYYTDTLLALHKIRERVSGKIAVILPLGLDSEINRRILSACDSFEQRGTIPLLHTGNESAQTTAQLRESLRTPHTILCWNHLRFDWLASQFSMPRSLIAGLHLVHPTPGHCGILVPYRELGSIAVDLLIQKIYQGSPASKPIRRGTIVPGSWIEG